MNKTPEAVLWSLNVAARLSHSSSFSFSLFSVLCIFSIYFSIMYPQAALLCMI